jgi:hypothetical protein
VLWLLVTHATNQAPSVPLPTGLVPLCLQCYCNAFLEPTPGKQAPELPLPKSLVSPCLQKLLCLKQQTGPGLLLPAGALVLVEATAAPESPCLNTSRPQELHCLLGTRQFKPSSFASPQASSTCYSVSGDYPQACSHPSEPQAPCLAILLVPGVFFPHRPQNPFCGRVPVALSKSRNPATPLSDNLPFCGCQESCFPKAQKDQHFPLCLTTKEPPLFP